MTTDYLAATRDASWFDRPDTRSTKVFHACDAGKLHSSGQRWGQQHRLLTAVCSQQVLDDNSAVRLDDVPRRLRCRRTACARIWQQHDRAAPGTAHFEPTAAGQSGKVSEMDQREPHPRPPIMFVVDETAGLFDEAPAVSGRTATALLDDLLAELRALQRATRQLPPTPVTRQRHLHEPEAVQLWPTVHSTADENGAMP
ncbi:MAG: hypothetical protein QOF58_2799 [Pseudonocardiales bacterium]|jgi:hypothetical protein|nr:hypothetical protein [Pseudonocardiales bacterium]